MSASQSSFPITATTPDKFISEKGLSADYDLSIERIDIGSLQSYHAWKRKLQRALNANVEKGTISTSAVYDARKTLGGDACIYTIGGPARVLYFMWGNGEVKILPIWRSKFIIQPVLYWLPSYPFLKRIKDCNHPDIQLYVSDGLVSSSVSSDDKFSVFLNASHNNHFGHFLLDSLPLLSCLNGPLGAKYAGKPMKGLYSYGRGINELLSFAEISIRNHEMCESGNPSIRHYSVEYRECLDIVSSSTFVNAYLWRRKYLRLERVRSLKQPSRRIALLRSGDFATRISNRVEVDCCLLANGFKIIDPSSLEISDLVDILINADLVVCESGSCTLNACMFSGNKTRILSLNPARLLLRPDSAMVHGGLPYLLPFIDRIEFIHGNTRVASGIQSSDLCDYDLRILEQRICN